MNISRLLHRYLILSIILMISALGVHPIPNDDNDRDIRHNPDIPDQEQIIPGSKNIAQYPFINYNLNYIDLNGQSWASLAQKLSLARHDGTFKVVHIGDSHIQAEGNTSIVRQKLQDIYGNAGRGLIIPFRLAGTNQPLDYRITSSTTHTTAKLLKKPWATTMGFTGISISTPNSPFTLSLSNASPVDAITIHGNGDIDVISVSTPEGNKIGFKTSSQSTKGVSINLAHPVQGNIDIIVNAHHGNIYGIELKRDHHGILYSAIGNNGATFSTYNDIPDFANGIHALDPDLIIIALGTNEAFGKLSDNEFYNQIRSLVNNIRRANPAAQLLLVTPSECQRSVYRTITSGSKRKRRRRRVRSFAVNSNVARMANVIRQFGAENHIPVYDFYNIAGGKGASDLWLKNRLLSNDRIHRTWAGYRVEGQLLAQALYNAIAQDNNTDDNHTPDQVQQQINQAMSIAFSPNKNNHRQSTEKSDTDLNKDNKQQVNSPNKQPDHKVKHSSKKKKSTSTKNKRLKKSRKKHNSKAYKNKKRSSRRHR
ncbi:MAG: hypothetical protein J6C44_04475 [Muribaculaceae bacterium]|nr:hypothetical protein [Muribaculaceae bacterium]